MLEERLPSYPHFMVANKAFHPDECPQHEGYANCG
jgi:hypothetical protein